jgi:peptidoglycan hydrolase CwlO-like protein
MFFSKKKIIFFILAIFLLGFCKNFVYAEDSSIQECRDNRISVENCPSYLQNKINNLQTQENTLSSQISIMNSQINLTEAKIEANKREILDLSLDIDTAIKKIDKLQDSLKKITDLWVKRVVATYEAGGVKPIEVLLSSSNASNLLTRLNYLKIVKRNDEKLIIDVQQAKNDYTNQKDIYEAKKKKVESLKKQLEIYTDQLSQEKDNKQRLLTETQGNEGNYQRLLSQAQAQLAAFSSFVVARGGASILENQTVCDDGWSGCYYNQRDSQWGNLALNNTQYTIASDGCLVTSMAMVYTHYSHRGVNPISINSNSNNFASYYPAYLKYTITADGATSSRVRAIIDSVLSSGDPVVVGVSYDGGPIPDHFVVLISGSGGNYKMNDPFTPNGHNIPFTDHYSIGGIREINKVTF